MIFKPTTKLIKYYFYISVGDLGTAMGYTSEVKYIFIYVPYDILYKYACYIL